jgi:hypothetical protein
VHYAAISFSPALGKRKAARLDAFCYCSYIISGSFHAALTFSTLRALSALERYALFIRRNRRMKSASLL